MMTVGLDLHHFIRIRMGPRGSRRHPVSWAQPSSVRPMALGVCHQPLPRGASLALYLSINSGLIRSTNRFRLVFTRLCAPFSSLKTPNWPVSFRRPLVGSMTSDLRLWVRVSIQNTDFDKRTTCRRSPHADRNRRCARGDPVPGVGWSRRTWDLHH